METDQPNSKAKVITGIVILVVVVVIVFGVKALSSKNTAVATPSTAPATTSTTTQPSVSADSTTTSTPTYKDGNYTATGSYQSPGGTESITVHITVKDDTVTSTTAQSGANDPTAQQLQDEFIQGYKAQVVGKNINTIKLSHVSGSSLTSQGFNDALAQIRNQAKA